MTLWHKRKQTPQTLSGACGGCLPMGPLVQRTRKVLVRCRLRRPVVDQNQQVHDVDRPVDVEVAVGIIERVAD